MEENVRYQVGTDQANITPNISESNYWLAGYTPDRLANSVNDPLYARAMVIDDGTSPFVIVSTDLVGLTSPDVQLIQEEITARVPELAERILVHSTHNHEAPDTIGLWGGTGQIPFIAPRSREYIKEIAESSAEAVANAWNNRQEVNVTVANLDSSVVSDLVEDNRQPNVIPSDVGLLVFSNESGVVGTLVNWASHPEVLGNDNQSITADFVKWLNDEIEAQLGGSSIYINGAIGGLLTSESSNVLPELPRETFEKAEAVGREVARRLVQQLNNPGNNDQVATYSTLPRVNYSTREFYLPVNNSLFLSAEILNRVPTKIYSQDEIPPEERWRSDSSASYVLTEGNYIDFGPISILTMGGELYPELLVGGIDPSLGIEPFNKAPVEVPLATNPQWQTHPFNFFFGLTNDFLGYFIPQSQWDSAEDGEYGEEFSPAPDAGSILSYNLHLLMTGYKTGVYPDSLPEFLTEPERERTIENFSDGSELLDNPLVNLVISPGEVDDSLLNIIEPFSGELNLGLTEEFPNLEDEFFASIGESVSDGLDKIDEKLFEASSFVEDLFI